MGGCRRQPIVVFADRKDVAASYLDAEDVVGGCSRQTWKATR